MSHINVDDLVRLKPETYDPEYTFLEVYRYRVTEISRCTKYADIELADELSYEDQIKLAGLEVSTDDTVWVDHLIKDRLPKLEII